jgi:hypothetical protein
MAPYTLAQEMHQKISGSKFIAFNGGHMFLFFKSQPFVDAVLDFLAEPITK